MLLQNKKQNSHLRKVIFGVLSFISFNLLASNDSITPKIGVSIGVNLTMTNIVTQMNANRDLTKYPGAGFFIEGIYNRPISKSLIIEIKILLENRHTADVRNTLIFSDLVGNTLGSVIPEQNNYFASACPMIYYTLNQSLSIGIGPSASYLAQSIHYFTVLNKIYKYSALSYYKRFHSEINSSLKITLGNTVLSLGYSYSIRNKIKGGNSSMKEYDNIVRLGLGYIFNNK